MSLDAVFLPIHLQVHSSICHPSLLSQQSTHKRAMFKTKNQFLFLFLMAIEARFPKGTHSWTLLQSSVNNIILYQAFLEICTCNLMYASLPVCKEH